MVNYFGKTGQTFQQQIAALVQPTPTQSRASTSSDVVIGTKTIAGVTYKVYSSPTGQTFLGGVTGVGGIGYISGLSVSPKGVGGTYTPTQIPPSLAGAAYDSVWDAQANQYVSGSGQRGQQIISGYYSDLYASATQSAEEKRLRDLAVREATLGQAQSEIISKQESYATNVKTFEEMGKKPTVAAMPFYGKTYLDLESQRVVLEKESSLFTKLASDYGAYAKGYGEQVAFKNIDIMKQITPDVKYGRTAKGQIMRTGGISPADYGKTFYIEQPTEKTKPKFTAEETFLVPTSLISPKFQAITKEQGLLAATLEAGLYGYGQTKKTVGELSAASLFWLPDEKKTPWVIPIESPATKIITGARALAGFPVRGAGQPYSFGYSTKQQAQEAARAGGEILFDWFLMQKAGEAVANWVKPIKGVLKDAEFFGLESPKGNITKFFVTGKSYLEPSAGKLKGYLSKFFYGAGKKTKISGIIDVKTLAKYQEEAYAPFGVRITAGRTAGVTTMEITTKSLSTKQLAADISLAQKQAAIKPLLERGVYYGKAEFKELKPNVLKNIFGGKTAQALFSPANLRKGKAIKFKYGQTGFPAETSFKLKITGDEYNKTISQYMAGIKGEITGKQINIWKNIFGGKEAQALLTKTETKQPYYGYVWQKVVSKRLPKELGIKRYSVGKMGGVYRFEDTGFTSIVEPSEISVIQRYAAKMPKGKIYSTGRITPLKFKPPVEEKLPSWIENFESTPIKLTKEQIAYQKGIRGTLGEYGKAVGKLPEKELPPRITEYIPTKVKALTKTQLDAIRGIRGTLAEYGKAVGKLPKEKLPPRIEFAEPSKAIPLTKQQIAYKTGIRGTLAEYAKAVGKMPKEKLPQWITGFEPTPIVTSAAQKAYQKGIRGTLAKYAKAVGISEKAKAPPKTAQVTLQQAGGQIVMATEKAATRQSDKIVSQKLAEQLTTGAAKMVEARIQAPLKTGMFSLTMPKTTTQTMPMTTTVSGTKLMQMQFEEQASFEKTFERMGQPEKLSQRIMIETGTIQKLVERTTSIERQIEKQMEKLGEKLAPIEKTAQKITPRMAQRVYVAQKMLTPQKLKFFEIGKMPPMTPPVIIPKIPVIWRPTGKAGDMEKSAKALTKGFDVFAKRQGKFFQLSKQPLSKLSALSLGAKWADITAGASFKIMPAKTPAIASPLKDWQKLGYRFYRGKKGAFVEKTGYRISAFGEKQEITYKGIAASKMKARMARL